jgi:hypothetical protein
VSDPSVPEEAARAAVLKEALSLRIEEELARLYGARPELSDRIDRASSLVVRQLSSPPHLRCIRVRIGLSGAHFLVDSSSTPGATYSVDPNGWNCSCPDHHRRDRACKHALAAYLLWRVSLNEDLRTCADCGARRRKRDMVMPHADNHENHDNPTYSEGDSLCASCADAAGNSR